MANVHADGQPDGKLPQNTPHDQERARELYKYFQPPGVDSAQADTVLAAHAQLVAWRLNAERSMISLIDEETQYFVAESTKTLHLDNNKLHDDPGDAIWAGVSSFRASLALHSYKMPRLTPSEVRQSLQSWSAL